MDILCIIIRQIDIFVFVCRQSLLRGFIKREVLHDITALQLTELDVTDKTVWLSPQDISIGLGAESVLKVV